MARRLSVSSKWTVIHDRVLRVGSMCDPRHPTTKIRDRLIAIALYCVCPIGMPRVWTDPIWRVHIASIHAKAIWLPSDNPKRKPLECGLSLLGIGGVPCRQSGTEADLGLCFRALKIRRLRAWRMSNDRARASVIV